MGSFSHYGEYKCICGKTFDYSQKFNAHKANCKEYLIHVGKYEKVRAAKTQAARTGRTKGAATRKLHQEQKVTQLALEWANEDHFCERCGATMLIKYASGRFCSSQCAHSRTLSDEGKIRKSKALSEAAQVNDIRNKNIEEYLLNPKYCSVCGKMLEYEQRNHKTCSSECKRESISKSTRHTKEIIGKHVEGRHIVYKVICLLDNRYYIGVRKTDEDFDGYLGSGIHIRNMVKAYGRKNFIRETLYEFNNSTDAFNKEKELLKEHLDNPLCVNIASGGQGGRTHG